MLLADRHAHGVGEMTEEFPGRETAPQRPRISRQPVEAA
jgi:hypothetical protein